MTTDVTVPAAGESVTSANVARWHFSHGDTVQKGDVLVTLETDKVSNELEADANGILEILVNEGEEVAIGTLIAHITASEPGAQPAAAPMPAGTSATTAPQPPALPQAEPSQSTAATAPIALAVPPAGESITSATVAKWLKNDGDQVTMGETLVILETDKVSNELEAPANGILHIITPEGDEVEIGTTIASIDPGGRELQP
ncbi:MAG: biotin/lipoyl-containing protein, partial [Verrucomicrobiales bacterium]